MHNNCKHKIQHTLFTGMVTRPEYEINTCLLYISSSRLPNVFGDTWKVDIPVYSHNQERSNYPLLWPCLYVCWAESAIKHNTTLNRLFGT